MIRATRRVGEWTGKRGEEEQKAEKDNQTETQEENKKEEEEDKGKKEEQDEEHKQQQQQQQQQQQKQLVTEYQQKIFHHDMLQNDRGWKQWFNAGTMHSLTFFTKKHENNWMTDLIFFSRKRFLFLNKNSHRRD